MEGDERRVKKGRRDGPLWARNAVGYGGVGPGVRG